MCKTPLESAGPARYETLDEHVMCNGNDPEWEPPLRDTYICPNEDCWRYSNGFWDAFGSGMYNTSLDTGHPWCYDGFYFDSIQEDYNHDRPHSAPKKPLTVDLFCMRDDCPNGRLCFVKTRGSSKGVKEGYNKTFSMELDGVKIRHFLCEHYNHDAVYNFFKEYDDIHWYDKCLRCGSHRMFSITGPMNNGSARLLGYKCAECGVEKMLGDR